jgi:hypothetical protein
MRIKPFAGGVLIRVDVGEVDHVTAAAHEVLDPLDLSKVIPAAHFAVYAGSHKSRAVPLVCRLDRSDMHGYIMRGG